MRLIDADALITTVQGTESEVAKNSPYDAEWYTRMADRQREIIGIVERMPTIEQPTWISCAERLPDENELTLAWSEPTRDMFFSCGGDFEGFEVTHWMPIPKPSKGDE